MYLRKILACSILVATSSLLAQVSHAATPATALKICSNTTKGTLTARGKCKSGETVLTPTTFTGATGATGAAGAAGATGETGARGASAFDAIPSGTTVYGVIGADGNESTAGGDWYGFASLPAKTSQVLTSSDILVSNTSNIDNDCSGAAACLGASAITAGAACTGSVDTPTAPSGKVCIYITGLSSSRMNAASLSPFVLAGSTPTVTPGFMIGWTTSSTGDSYLRAVWAYTAP